jgi:alkaline phosphatase D
VVPAAAFATTASLSKPSSTPSTRPRRAPWAARWPATIAGLAAASKSVAAMTLYGLIQQKLATALGIGLGRAGP